MDQSKNKIPFSGIFKMLLPMFLDILIIWISTFLAMLLRLEFSLSTARYYILHILIFCVAEGIVYSAIYFACRLHLILWEYASGLDQLKLCLVATSSFLFSFAFCEALNTKPGIFLPRSFYLISLALSILFMIGMRSIIRERYRYRHKRLERSDIINDGNILVIGGGQGGYILLQDILNNPAMKGSRVRCVIDNNPEKIGRKILGIPIVGSFEELEEAVRKYNIDTIILAIPSLSVEKRTEILRRCSKTGCALKCLPSLTEQPSNISSKDIRKVNINDLLGREPIKLDLTVMKELLAEKTVLVTGGGGSIGSELCRQIASCSPGKLIIFDIYENNAYDIQNELRRNFPDVTVVTLIGSVRDTKRINSVFETYHPEYVFHAAAHKHVPLMEDSPLEAIKNNVFGTFNVAAAADRYGVRRFVQVSTDKAVNPTNVMGATKRICEMIVQYYNRYSETEFVAVRFGNVLGSNGSVIPLFERQIAEGGPVTVTDPRIIRYFMTIPEAVSLILTASAFAKGGEIFVLDMGKPVRILDMAEEMIRLSGKEPYRDIEIRFTGLRPGEKLYEELLMAEEGMTKTQSKLIYIGKALDFDDKTFINDLHALEYMIRDESADVRPLIRKLVPGYHDPVPSSQEGAEDVNAENCEAVPAL